MKEEILQALGEHTAAGTPCVLATVVRVEPPTSARPGDQAIITGDGHLRGWIGGSCAEPVVRREALRALADGRPRVVRIVPAADAVEGGPPGQVTRGTTCPSGGTLEVFIEPQLPRPLLIAFGDSPAARALLEMGAIAGFRTCAVHPGARADDFQADLVLPSLDLAAAAPGADTWAVSATMGHYDEDALEAALAHPGVDVALIASRRRAAAVLEALRGRGLDAATLAKVRTPAGALRGAAQEEIALLALAQLVALRRERLSAPTAAPEPEGFAVDPVCGMTVDAARSRHTITRGGVTIHFCSEGCLRAFERDPEHAGA